MRNKRMFGRKTKPKHRGPDYPPFDEWSVGAVHVRVWLNWRKGNFNLKADFHTKEKGQWSWRFRDDQMDDLVKATIEARNVIKRAKSKLLSQ